MHLYPGHLDYPRRPHTGGPSQKSTMHLPYPEDKHLMTIIPITECLEQEINKKYTSGKKASVTGMVRNYF